MNESASLEVSLHTYSSNRHAADELYSKAMGCINEATNTNVL